MVQKVLIVACSVFLVNTAQADNVEIFLIDMLDNTQSGYCIDIARAQGDKANPADGLQGHTCYSPKGEIMSDQIFDTDKFSDGLLYMPKFDVCAQVSSFVAGASIGLEVCDGSAGQSFEFSSEGTIVPTSATDLCVTVAEDTRTGRSDVNQIKVLTLEVCAADMSAYQNWSVRSSI